MLLNRQTVRSLRVSSRQRRPHLQCFASIQARWCFDARYGRKQEATALLQEWVQTVGCSAGLTASNTRLSSGSLGVPESRMEMEVTFDSMADWEAFLSRIPFHEHKAWTQRIASMVVDGSPVWQVHRSIPLTVAPPSESTTARTAPPPSSTAGDKQLIVTDQISTADMAAWEQLKRDSSSPSRVPQPQQAEPIQVPAEDDPETPVQRDWKGDPIKFNPGDKLPFKFL